MADQLNVWSDICQTQPYSLFSTLLMLYQLSYRGRSMIVPNQGNIMQARQGKAV